MEKTWSLHASFYWLASSVYIAYKARVNQSLTSQVERESESIQLKLIFKQARVYRFLIKKHALILERKCGHVCRQGSPGGHPFTVDWSLNRGNYLYSAPNNRRDYARYYRGDLSTYRGEKKNLYALFFCGKKKNYFLNVFLKLYILKVFCFL